MLFLLVCFYFVLKINIVKKGVKLYVVRLNDICLLNMYYCKKKIICKLIIYFNNNYLNCKVKKMLFNIK